VILCAVQEISSKPDAGYLLDSQSGKISGASTRLLN
jgi:hypothetical protein